MIRKTSDLPAGARRAAPPSVRDVAAVAGVSCQTVSRVLNGSASVRPDTRGAVPAVVILMSLPLIAILVVAQRKIIAGIASGAVK